jgi:hypothetical protein
MVRIRQHGRNLTMLLALGALVALASGCGSSAPGAQPDQQLDQLQVTMSGRGMAIQRWTSQNGTAIQQLYQHVRSLQQIPSTTDIACQPAQRTYAVDFKTGNTTVLTATTWQCRGYIQLSSDNAIRRLDGTFWQLLSSAVGQTLQES